ncbi:arginine vasopressin-induced protein 1 [Betta splendens]|uniref:Arginine vasopressin-induced protein 1 n=1 Tax=Betta splendens TaxID=158456 RepID=A0A6P7KPC4_BETSP|nr:arginine vasopressin-induced protein 1 [Betta splendens]
MLPSSAFLRMDTGPGAPPSSAVAGPPSLWRLAERRSRKAGSANIFSSVHLWQLQRLFRAAGDQDAEQRAQLVWGHRDEAELAQALIGLRARSHHRGLRSGGREALGSHWLRAFNHLRIRESSPSRQGKDAGEQSETEAAAQGSLEPHQHASVSATGKGGGAAGRSDGPSAAGAAERAARLGSGLRRGGEKNPERYLHRILR